MERNYLYDNTKFLMIFLVVFGHLLEPLAEQGGLVRALYMSIYSFHMPVFVLLCGLLTKPDPQGDPSAKIIQSLLVPFIAFTLLYELFNLLTTGRISHYSAGLQPYWLLWFLFSLFCWRLLAPFFMKLKYPLPTAFALALAAGYSEQIGYFLGLSRTLFFFPFFLVGQQMVVSGFDVSAWRRRLPRYLPIAVVAANFLFFLIADDFSARWLFGSVSYATLGAETFGAFARCGIYALSLSTAAAVLMLIPQEKTWMSERGANTLHVYAWHGFVVKLFSLIGLFAFAGKLPQALGVVLWFLVAVGLTVALSGPAVARFTQRRLLDPLAKRLLREG
ncbi:MAG: hypothetical protein RBT64_10455 [Trichloromonas sp.]|jgi:fucose 4-O-acetylase-like acetyltransferase|nr:hypothetical protein [Trichloromonas sp.]